MSEPTPPPPPPPSPIIVVGSGLAGLCASYEALGAGRSVHMLERAAKPGGNSIKASSGINGAGTRFQKASGIISDESFYDDTVRSAGAQFQAWKNAPAQPRDDGNVPRENLIRTLVDESAGAVTWLVDEMGVDLSVVAPLGGHTVARTHRGAGKLPPGAAMVTTLLKKLQANPAFTLTTSATVTELRRREDGTVTGVTYTEEGATHELDGPVVFATGGFAGDAHGLLAHHRPDLAGLPSTNEARPGSHGVLVAAGAALIDMDSVQVHPTGFVDPAARGAVLKFLAAEMLRGEGGILLDAEGKRFVNEMETREKVSAAIMSRPPLEESPETTTTIRQWDVTLLLDPGACDAAGSHVGFYLFKGLVQKKKIRDLPAAVIASIDRYCGVVAAGRDDDFGRTQFGHWRLLAGEGNRDEEVCVGKVTPIVHFTMGGAAFNELAQVLREKTGGGGALEPIPGLFAAGEITGGIHGDNRLGGSSLLETVVFGRIAGREAAKS